MSGSWDPARFPNLGTQNHQITSAPDTAYNCIAWAAGDQSKWWWPHPDSYWPDGAPEEVTLEAFRAAYGQMGFAECQDGSLEAGFEKVAIYATPDAAGKLSPTHAARQLSDGRWASKLGKLEDIEHQTVNAVDGPAYGSAAMFLKRASKP